MNVQRNSMSHCSSENQIGSGSEEKMTDKIRLPTDLLLALVCTTSRNTKKIA
jgi:hypothetical protein